MIRGINHLTFSVRDVAESFAFYRDALGFRPVAKWPRGAYLLAGDVWIALHFDPETRPGALPEYTHAAFRVDAKDFDAMAARIQAAGARIWQENWTEGASLYFLDPNGHKLEIHATDLAARIRSAREDPWEGLEITELGTQVADAGPAWKEGLRGGGRPGGLPFAESARLYDRLYSFKDYAAEARKLAAILREALGPGRHRLLDVACGTGRHLGLLRPEFDGEGLDVSEGMLEAARARNPGVAFHLGDMRDFDLGRSFDAVVCLFSSIGYVKTLEGLEKALRAMARHVRPGGVLAVEPWFTPSAWKAGTVHASLVDEPGIKIARVNTSFAEGRLSLFDLHHLVATPQGTEHFVERHELGLFEVEEMRAAFSGVGLETRFDPEGLTGRGLYVGRRKA